MVIQTKLIFQTKEFQYAFYYRISGFGKLLRLETKFSILYLSVGFFSLAVTNMSKLVGAN